MVALQIRDVPADVRDTLAERARRRGQSLQAYLLALVTDEADRSNNATLLERFHNRDDGTSIGPSDVTEALHAARAERDAELDERLAIGN